MKIAIVGRPNVGKSALFNRICQRRVSIVDEEEGVTRDRIYARGSHFGKEFELIDTGGIDFSSKRPFNEEVKKQSKIAINEADALIIVVDGLFGPTDLDRAVVELVFKSKKPLVLAINKIDDISKEELIMPFFKLGVKKMVGISAIHGYQIAELLDEVLKECAVSEPREEKSCRIALIGATNVGKSTLLNAVLNEERVIISPIHGTTRDNVNVSFALEDKEYVFIDTAGIRKKNSESSTVEKFSHIRTKEAIKRADVCLLLLDVLEGIRIIDKKIFKMIEQEGKGIILLFNKWDLIKGIGMEVCLKAAKEQFLGYPILFISALLKRNVDKIFFHVESVKKQLERKVSTPLLNKFIEGAIAKYHPPMIMGKRLRIYYMTQKGTFPPRFVLFVNYPDLMVESYKKYLINKFRENFGFEGVPIVFEIRKKT